MTMKEELHNNEERPLVDNTGKPVIMMSLYLLVDQFLCEGCLDLVSDLPC